LSVLFELTLGMQEVLLESQNIVIV